MARNNGRKTDHGSISSGTGNGTLEQRALAAAALEAETAAFEASGREPYPGERFVHVVAALTGTPASEIEIIGEHADMPASITASGTRRYKVRIDGYIFEGYWSRAPVVRYLAECSADECGAETGVTVRSLADAGRAMSDGIACAAHSQRAFAWDHQPQVTAAKPPEPELVPAWPVPDEILRKLRSTSGT